MDGANFEHLSPGALDRVISQIDWAAEIDPTLSAATNYAIIKDRYGLKSATDVTTEARNADDQARDSARRAIREHLAAIDAGDADELLADIETEYGEQFVAAELERARGDDRAEITGAPEPKAWSLSAIGATATEPPEPVPDPSPAPASPSTPEPAGLEISPADDGRPDPGRTPTPTADAGRSLTLPNVRPVASAALAPIKLLCIVLYVLLTAPLDATHPEVTADV